MLSCYIYQKKLTFDKHIYKLAFRLRHVGKHRSHRRKFEWHEDSSTLFPHSGSQRQQDKRRAQSQLAERGRQIFAGGRRVGKYQWICRKSDCFVRRD